MARAKLHVVTPLSANAQGAIRAPGDGFSSSSSVSGSNGAASVAAANGASPTPIAAKPNTPQKPNTTEKPNIAAKQAETPKITAPAKPAAKRAAKSTADGATKKRSTKAPASIRALMNPQVVCCRAHDPLSVVGQLMWENDIGVVVVVDDAHHPQSVVTDRDVAMAAYTQGAPLSAISAASCMSNSLQTCASDAPPTKVLELMRKHRVRRMPVVDSGGALVGLVGLTDIVRAVEQKKAKSGITKTQIVDTVTGILV